MRLREIRPPTITLALLVMALAVTPAIATAPKVATVPWNPAGGVYTFQHTTYDGYSMLLMGVAEDHDGDAPLVSYEWTFGDATGTGVIPFGATPGPLNLEVRHAYTGVDGTPYTAQLTVCDSNAECTTDDFRLVVKNMTLDIEVNISLDEGLWYLHKTLTKFPDGATGEPSGRWTDYGGYSASPTSSVVQAFEINEHLPTGNPDEDPYVDTVVRGINYMLTQLARVNTADQVCQASGTGFFNPDSDGNLYSLGVSSSRPLYETGQVMDALAASRQPGLFAVTGVAEVLGESYFDIMTDMADYYAYCMDDSGGDQGGWRYSCHNDSDNSACQWAAIGYLGAEAAFGVPTPPCVQSQNQLWLNASHIADGRYGYTGLNCNYNCIATTPSGMTELAMNDIPTTDPRWVDAEKWLCDNWTAGSNILNSQVLYSYYAIAKAMRGAFGGADATLGDDLSNPCATPVNWYDDDPGGLARRLVDTQYSDGTWGSNWIVGRGALSTSWSIIILKPTLFCPSPVADCAADPAATTVDCPVELDGSQSFHPGFGQDLPGCGTEIVSWDWDFDDGTFASGDMASHSFGAFGTFNVKLTVTDDVGTASSTFCPVTVGPPPIDPDSNPNGPYLLCTNQFSSEVILDGEGSLDPDNSPCQGGNGIAQCAWELDFAEFPPDFDDAFGCTYDATADFAALGPGTYDVGLRVTDDEGVTNDDFTIVTVADDTTNPDCIVICPEDADPSSQGYWHRQCLGLPAPVGIDPGRNGRGPQSPTEPDFEEILLPAVNTWLEDLGFFGETTCSGMDADPANDPCEKALKQFTALLLNVASGRLAEGCPVDPDASSCSATDVGGLIAEINGLIHAGDCNAAKECAAAMNEGESLAPFGGPGESATPQAAVAATTDAGGPTELQSNTDRRTPVTLETGYALQRRPGIRAADSVAGIERGGRILYYLVSPDYVTDDPRVRIMSIGSKGSEPGLTRAEAFGPKNDNETPAGTSDRPARTKTPARGGRGLP